MRVINVFLLVLLVTMSCQSKLSPQQYLQWVQLPENGLLKHKQVAGYIFELQYKPLDYLLLKERRLNPINQAYYQAEKKALAGMYYFTLRMRMADGKTDFLKADLQSETQYYQRLNYYSFGFGRDVQLINGHDTIPCSILHLERAYDLSNACTLLLAFARKDTLAHDLTLVMHPRELSLGTLKLKIDQPALRAIPAIQL